MTGAAFSFLAVATADLVAGGLGGTPAGRRRVWAGIAAAALVLLAGASLADWSLALAVALGVSLLGVAAWLFVRSVPKIGPRRAWGALTILGAHLALGIAGESWWQVRSLDGLGDWLESLAFPALNMLEGESLLLIIGLFLFLSATTNGIVRLLLIAAGTRAGRSEERLRGGRMIGVLERWLIVALMLAGQPTAAGLVVSAKSILRFPELNQAARESPGGERGAGRVDHVTEYFLLGSLCSWFVAVVLALLFVGPF